MAEEIATVRWMLVATRWIPDGYERWELHDLLDAGRDMVAELDVLMMCPVSEDVLELADEAARMWASFLYTLNEVRDCATEPISAALTAVHVRLYEASDLADDPFLDVPDAFADLLGDEGIDEFWDQVSAGS